MFAELFILMVLDSIEMLESSSTIVELPIFRTILSSVSMMLDFFVARIISFSDIEIFESLTFLIICLSALDSIESVALVVILPEDSSLVEQPLD